VSALTNGSAKRSSGCGIGRRFDRGAGLVARGAPEVADDRAQGQVECFPLGGEVRGTAEYSRREDVRGPGAPSAPGLDSLKLR
jgi:hypothetical protein